MQVNGKMGSRLGMFMNPATGQQVGATAMGSYTVEANVAGDPSNVVPQVNAVLVQALKDVIGAKIASRQVPMESVGAAVPQMLGEIAAAAGLERFGARFVALEIHVRMDLPEQPAAAPTGFGAPQQPGMPQGWGGAPQQPGMPQGWGGAPQQPAAAGGFGMGGVAGGLVAEAKSRMMWWAISAVVFLVVAGFGAFMYYRTTHSVESAVNDANRRAAAARENALAAAGATVESDWDGTEPFTCGGSRSVRIEGVRAAFTEGTAIKAAGSCRLELVDVEVSAPVAIEAAASARVTVRGGRITGTEFAAKAGASSRIVFEGTTVEGETKAGPSAAIEGP
jgi:hypothetical protein